MFTRFRTLWLTKIDLIFFGLVFMSMMNAINSIFTLIGQLPEKEVFNSPQYIDLSQQTRVIYICVLLIVILVSLRYYYIGSMWLILAVGTLRILDNLHPQVNPVNIGMWVTVLAIGYCASVTLFRLEPEQRAFK